MQVKMQRARGTQWVSVAIPAAGSTTPWISARLAGMPEPRANLPWMTPPHFPRRDANSAHRSIYLGSYSLRDDSRDGGGTSPWMGEVDRAGSERSRPRREQAVEDKGSFTANLPLTRASPRGPGEMMWTILRSGSVPRVAAEARFSA